MTTNVTTNPTDLPETLTDFDYSDDAADDARRAVTVTGAFTAYGDLKAALGGDTYELLSSKGENLSDDSRLSWNATHCTYDGELGAWQIDADSLEPLRDVLEDAGYALRPGFETDADAAQEAIEHANDIAASVEEGDRVRVVYEQKNGNGTNAKEGNVRYAETDAPAAMVAFERDDDVFMKLKVRDGEFSLYSPRSHSPYVGEVISVEVGVSVEGDDSEDDAQADTDADGAQTAQATADTEPATADTDGENTQNCTECGTEIPAGMFGTCSACDSTDYNDTGDATVGATVEVTYESAYNGGTNTVRGEVVEDAYTHRDTPDGATDIDRTDDDGTVRVTKDGRLKGLHHATKRHDTRMGTIVQIEVVEDADESGDSDGDVIDFERFGSGDAVSVEFERDDGTLGDFAGLVRAAEPGGGMLVESGPNSCTVLSNGQVRVIGAGLRDGGDTYTLVKVAVQGGETVEADGSEQGEIPDDSEPIAAPCSCCGEKSVHHVGRGDMMGKKADLFTCDACGVSGHVSESGDAVGCMAPPE